jgi:hypothetical protein
VTTTKQHPGAVDGPALFLATGTSVYHRQPTYQGTMNPQRSAHVLHHTTDPDVFIAEIDTAARERAGQGDFAASQGPVGYTP